MKNIIVRSLKLLILPLAVVAFAFVIGGSAQPAQASLTSCTSGNPTFQQPSGSVLRYFANWTVTFPTNSALCYYQHQNDVPPVNASPVNELTGSNTKDFLCDSGGEMYLPVLDSNGHGVMSNGYYLEYPVGHGLCYKNLQMSHSNEYTITNLITGKILAAGEHIKVGDQIQVVLNSDPSYNNNANYDTSVNWNYTFGNIYVDVAANSYTNLYPANSWFETFDRNPFIYLHCPGAGSAPACKGVDTNFIGFYALNSPNGYNWAPRKRFDSFSGSSLAQVQTVQYPDDPDQGYRFNLGLGSGWQIVQGYEYNHGGSSSAPVDVPCSYFICSENLVPTQAGTLRFTINDNGSYVVPYTYNCENCGAAPAFNAASLAGGTVATVDIPVDPLPVDNPPNTPVLSCPSTVAVFQNADTSFSSTDPDPADSVRYFIDSNYDGTTFNPTSSTQYVTPGVTQNMSFQWATVGTKKIAVRAQDLLGSKYSGLATCTVSVTAAQSPTTPNLQFALTPAGQTYTDNTVYYSLPVDAWGSAAAGVTIPARYIGGTGAQSCVFTPMPQGSRGSNPNSGFSTSWDSWPTVASPATYTSVQNGLKILGTSATAPAVGSSYTFQFQFGCGTTAQANAGQFTGAADVQTVVIQITPAGNLPFVSLQVTKAGGTPVDAPLSAPYTYPSQLASSGGTTAAGVSLTWNAYNVASCTFTRSDVASPIGTLTNSAWKWDGTQTTNSIFSGSEAVDVTFTAPQANPSYTFGFTTTCTGANGATTSSAYVTYQRAPLVPSTATYTGTVYQDNGGILGVQDNGEPGMPNQSITVTVSGYAGGPVSTTTTTDAQGNYTVSVPTTAAMLQTGVVSIRLNTPLQSGWTYTYPQTGMYSNYQVYNNSTTTFNFGERNGVAAMSTVTGYVYIDTSGNGVKDPSESGVQQQKIQMKLQRITEYSSLPTTTDDLATTYIDSTGKYSLATFVTSLPNGATRMYYKISDITPLSPGWQFSSPPTGAQTFDGVPNIVNTINFGLLPPVTYTGTVFRDALSTGQPAGQAPISGVTIQAYDSVGGLAQFYDLSPSNATPLTPVTSVTSAADGTYSIAVSRALAGHQITIREKPNSPNVYCTNPGPTVVTGITYCQNSIPDDITSNFGKTITHNFGNSDTPSAVMTVSGVVSNNDTGAGLSGVVVGIFDATNVNVPLFSSNTTDSTGSYSLSLTQSQYQALVGHTLVIMQTASSLSSLNFHVVSPSTANGGFSIAFDGSTISFTGYNFRDSSNIVQVYTPPSGKDPYFCDQD